ncbi:MAG: hypothetical protein II832_08395 [Synergistaceae bacterium]|nr:hypothetical protein [Synergistaceae bacterium]
MSALNMAVVSLHRITSSGDRLVLDREYDSIINNLRMGEINADPELTSLYQEIVRVIHKGRLRDDIRATINKADSEKKHKSIKEIITVNVLKSFSTNPLKWLGKLAMSSASEYFSQQKEAGTLAQNNNDGQLSLEHEELDEYDELQRKLLGSSWSLLRQYQLPDSYRLTQNALVKFSAAMNEQDPSKRQRMMKYLEGDFAMYAPYWFYRASAAKETGNNDEAEKFFARFGEVWRPVLRKDPYRAEAMKYRIEGLMRSGVTQDNAGEILECLAEMETAELPKPKSPPMGDSDFVELCKSGDVVKIEEAIINDADVNARDNGSWTALKYAKSNNHSKVAQLLRKNGAKEGFFFSLFG